METAKLSDGETASDDEFGTAVAISANIAVSGAQQNDDLAPNAGAAYVLSGAARFGYKRQNSLPKTEKLEISSGMLLRLVVKP